MSKGLNVTEPHSATAASTRCFPLNNPLEEKQGDRDNQREQGPGEDAGHGGPQDWQQKEVWF